MSWKNFTREERQHRYRTWSGSGVELAPFYRAEWLDITCGVHGWDAAVVFAGNDCVLAMPFQCSHKWGLSLHLPPPFSPFNGPWMKAFPEAKASEYRSRLWRLHTELAENLPARGLSIYHLDPAQSDGLPYVWAGFSIQTRYTFILETNRLTEEALWDGVKDKMRNHIRQGQRLQTVEPCAAPEELIACYEASFVRKKQMFPASREVLLTLLQVGNERGWFQSWVSRDSKGELSAALSLLTHRDRAWLMFQGTKGGDGNRGALAALVWKAILHCREKGMLLDFEGSMLEPVARHFGAFGARPVPYLRLYKDNILYNLWKASKAGNIQ